MKFFNLLTFLLFLSRSFFIDGAEGSFQQIAGSPFEAGANPASSAYSPLASGNLFAAVPNYGDNTVSVYLANQTTGSLAQVIGSPFATGSQPAWQTFSPIVLGNLFSAVANFNDNTVSVYEVNQTTGAFTPIAGSPFATGIGPASVQFSSVVSGNLFAAIPNTSDNTVSVYEVNQTTGAFTPVAGSPFPTGANPNFAAFSPVVSGNLFAAVADYNDNTVSVYEVNQTTGAFTPVPGSPFPTGASPYSVVFSPLASGNLFAIVANDTGNTLSVYEVNQTTGAFTQVPGSPFAAGIAPNELAVTLLPSGNLLTAAVDFNTNNVSVYEINPITGALTQVAGSPFATGIQPDGIAFSPLLSGNLLFAVVANFGDNTASVFQVTIIIPSPTVTSIVPNSGPVSGGTSVTITGTNFTGTTLVDFGTVPATFIVDSDTQITAISPPGTGTVDVTVTTPNGTSPTSAADLFTYIPAPLPPSQAKGFQKKVCECKRTTYVNILTWDPPVIATDIVAYSIFRNNQLIGEVSSQQRLEFADKDIKKGKTYTYYIRSINSLGLVSAPAIVIIKSKDRCKCSPLHLKVKK